jgi:hypothetical protein
MKTEMEKTENRTESEKLKDCAGVLSVLAAVSFIGGLVLLVLVAAQFYAEDETPLAAVAFKLWLGGGLCSTAILFFFFAQLFHIRAALVK